MTTSNTAGNTAGSTPGTTTNDPDALRAEIEQTRANLSQNVNALGEAVQPSNIAKRQVSKVTGAATGLKDKVMGSAEETASSLGDRASGIGESVSGVGSQVTGSVAGAGQTARSQTQGNPLAAGVIALGAGWLLGSLLPATSRERQAASAVKEQAQPLVGQAQEVAKEVAKEAAEELKEPAMAAAESVKSTAQDAAETVKAEGQSAAEDVRSSAQESKENVQGHQSQPGTSL
jgi:gas vesicle protein